MVDVILDYVDSYLSQLESAEHSAECVSSCYRCLRDYGNMAYHALLDWRLARDLFALLRGRELNVDTSAQERALQHWAAGFGAEMLQSLPAAASVFEHPQFGTYAVIARHPLEAAEQGLIAPRLALAHQLAEPNVPEITAVVFVARSLLIGILGELSNCAKPPTWCRGKPRVTTMMQDALTRPAAPDYAAPGHRRCHAEVGWRVARSGKRSANGHCRLNVMRYRGTDELRLRIMPSASRAVSSASGKVWR
jgi:hypothetical protein